VRVRKVREALVRREARRAERTRCAVVREELSLERRVHVVLQVEVRGHALASSGAQQIRATVTVLETGARGDAQAGGAVLQMAVGAVRAFFASGLALEPAPSDAATAVLGPGLAVHERRK